MFFLLVLLAWTGLHAYFFWHVWTIPAVRRRVPRAALLLVAAILWSSFLLSRLLERFGLEKLGQAFEVVGSTWIGVLFLAFVCLLGFDLLTGFGHLQPGWRAHGRVVALLVAAALCGIATIQAVRAPVVSEHELELPGLPLVADGTVVVVASDFHLGTMLDERWLADRVEQINALHPDLVVLAGDIVEGHGGDRRSFLPPLRRLAAPLGVWAVAGNHEGYGDAAGGQLLEEAGVQVLRDRWAEVRPGLVVAGVDDLTARRRRLGHANGFAEKALAGRPPGAATIFLSHTPWLPEQAAARGVGLMLSGHTHNGQIWPFTYIVGWVYPLRSGRYQVEGVPVIICRGTGTWGPRMRLWQRGELVRITLRPPQPR